MTIPGQAEAYPGMTAPPARPVYSFDLDSVAALLNRYFVPIKVDREERPDVDRLYMHAMQAMGSGGGWPLNVFLTPGLEPFFGGTYFPPRSLGGRPGLMELLPRIH